MPPLSKFLLRSDWVQLIIMACGQREKTLKTNASGLDDYAVGSRGQVFKNTAKTLNLGEQSAFELTHFGRERSRPCSIYGTVLRAKRLFGYPRDTRATSVPFCCM
jgi:hypothetical protein